MAFTLNNLKMLLNTAVQNRISDIHFRTNERPLFRTRGELIPVKMASLTAQDIVSLCQMVISKEKDKENFETLKEYDGSYSLPGVCRVRYNIFRYLDKLGLVFRIVPFQVPTIDELGISPVLKKIAEQRRGLVLVTGATGSGKSSTLAAMINHINRVRSCHILTLEDPIEFIHQNIKARVTQREIGSDSQDFIMALRQALRQDPDVILIGEMRDIETVSIALKAAETGHIVFATVHTTNVINTIGRLIAMFPPGEQEMVRRRLSDNLYSVVSQRLIPRRDIQAMVAVQEIMVTGPGIKDCINGKEELNGIYTFIENAYQEGKGQSFDQHLTYLHKHQIISLQEAKAAATSSEDFERSLILSES